jgi:hypothetical protein
MFPRGHENLRWIVQLHMNKEVESQSDKSIKDFGFILPLNFNLNAAISAEYIQETNCIFSSWKVRTRKDWGPQSILTVI